MGFFSDLVGGLFGGSQEPAPPQPSYSQGRDQETMQWLGVHPWATQGSINSRFGQYAPSFDFGTNKLNLPGNWYSQPRVDDYLTAFGGWNQFERPEGGVDYTSEPNAYIQPETQFERGETFRGAYEENAARRNPRFNRNSFVQGNGSPSIVRGMWDPTVRGMAQRSGWNAGQTTLDPVNQSPEARSAYEADYANQLNEWQGSVGYDYNALARQMMGGG